MLAYYMAVMFVGLLGNDGSLPESSLLRGHYVCRSAWAAIEVIQSHACLLRGHYVCRSDWAAIELFHSCLFRASIWMVTRMTFKVFHSTVERVKASPLFKDNIKEWIGLEWNSILRKTENREEWRKLVVKSTVVPQRSARLRGK